MEEREIKLSMTIEEINILIDLVNAAHRESFEKQVNLKYSSDNDGRDKELRRFMMIGDILSKLEMEKYKMENDKD
jgi:hypothetical protein